jgi:hypothetical protein
LAPSCVAPRRSSRTASEPAAAAGCWTVTGLRGTCHLVTLSRRMPSLEHTPPLTSTPSVPGLPLPACWSSWTTSRAWSGCTRRCRARTGRWWRRWGAAWAWRAPTSPTPTSSWSRSGT